MNITYKTLKAEDNYQNSFLADDDKVGDLVIATVVIDGEEISGNGETSEEANASLLERISNLNRRKMEAAKRAIARANGEYFFD